MTIPLNLLPQSLVRTRYTPYVVESQTVGQTVTIARNPTVASLLQFQLTGASSGTGTVYVTGWAAGATITEAVTFTTNGIKTTTNSFLRLSGSTSTGLADESTVGTITASTVTKTGQPVMNVYSTTSFRGFVTLRSTTMRGLQLNVVGPVVDEDVVMYTRPSDITIDVGDTITYDSRTWKVSSVFRPRALNPRLDYDVSMLVPVGG